MTEDEAKAKWCPFAKSRLVEWKSGPNTITNALWAAKDGDAPTTYCIASVCMAWRWSSAPIQVIGNDATGALTREDLPGGGYCGLAGRPD